MRGTKSKALRRLNLRPTKERRAVATGAQAEAIEARIAVARSPYLNPNWEKQQTMNHVLSADQVNDA